MRLILSLWCFFKVFSCTFLLSYFFSRISSHSLVGFRRQVDATPRRSRCCYSAWSNWNLAATPQSLDSNWRAFRGMTSKMIGLLFFKPAYRGSALRIGSSVYFFAVGWTDDDSYPIHRIEMGASKCGTHWIPAGLLLYACSVPCQFWYLRMSSFLCMRFRVFLFLIY